MIIFDGTIYIYTVGGATPTKDMLPKKTKGEKKTRTNRKLILAANRYGLEEGKRDNDEWTSWYTPVLQVAYEYGRRGIDLSDCDDVSGYRYGNIPDGGISMNHRDHESERGLSLAAIDGCEENWIAILLPERPKIKVSGLLLPKTGAEGEPLILAYGLEQYDY